LVLWYRRLRFGYSFRRIPLSQGKFAIVDPDDYPGLSKCRWYAARNKGTFYAVTGWWSKSDKKNIKIKMHRAIIDVPEGFVVDHINHNGLDNRKANLRLATFAQNARNSRRRQNCSGYKGVCFTKNRGKYRAVIWHNNKRIHLGYFNSPHQAAKAYDTAAKKYHKDFAVLNFDK